MIKQFRLIETESKQKLVSQSTHAVDRKQKQIALTMY